MTLRNKNKLRTTISYFSFDVLIKNHKSLIYIFIYSQSVKNEKGLSTSHSKNMFK